jgi:hypothetical protein
MILAASAESVNGQEGREVVAVVNGEEIFLDDLMGAVAARHQNMTGEAQPAMVGFDGALDRLIDTKLILQETRDIGLQERPEIRDDVRIYRQRLLLSLLKGPVLKDLQADEVEIERIYRDRVRTWKYSALVFETMENATAFKDDLEHGDAFEAAGQRYVEEGRAAWDGEERQARERDIAPELLTAFADKEVGFVTPVIKAVNRYFVFKLTGVTYPEDEASRLKAQTLALDLKKEETLESYTNSLFNKYVTVDKNVLETVGKDDFADMEKDSRVVARVQDEDPVRVADLLEHLKNKFYHGDKTPEYEKALRSGPEPVLREVLQERVFIREARELGIHQTEKFVRSATEYENSLLFGLYLEKFLAPQARVPEEEVRAAYEARKEEFLMPQRVEVDSLAFSERDGALKALERLKRGADLNWISENTPGLAEEGLVHDDLVLDTLPEDLREELARLRPDDVGFYDTGEDVYKVYVVKQVPPRQVQPYENVRYRIATELFNDRLRTAIEDLAAELRDMSEITIYKDKIDQGLLLKDQNRQ